MNKSLQVVVVVLSVLMGAVVTADAALYTASLVDDFSLSSNSSTDTWSYRQSAWAEAAPSPRFDFLLPENTRTANDLWATSFATPPTMRSGTAFNWGIGKNSSGNQTSGALTWPDGTVMLRPDFFGTGLIADPNRMVVSWRAPSAMTVNASWSFSRMSGVASGDGVAVQIDSFIGGLFTTGLNGSTFSGTSPRTDGGPVADSITSLAVSAGDRLFWTIDNWANETEDMTMASITINQVPEPASFGMLVLGGLALLRFSRRGSRRT